MELPIYKMQYGSNPCIPTSLTLGHTGTVNVDIFAQHMYIFSHISRRALDAHKFGVSENYNHNRTNRIELHGMHEN